jgi:branched-chain amino acid transport system permease protein
MRTPATHRRVFVGLLIIASLAALPFILSSYVVHLLIFVFVWSAITTAWSYMGRFGLLSFGHGAILGIGSYATALLFNLYGLSPWIGMLVAALIAVLFFTGLGYCCFRFGVAGHYFAITTLVETMIFNLIIINFRDITGGSLGLTIQPMGMAPLFFQFDNKIYFYFISLLFLLLTLYVWKRIDNSKMKKALIAIESDEIAAEAIGINIVKYKTRVTAISAFLTSLGGVIYSQYMMILSPDSLSGLHVSAIGVPFKAILGGIFNLWGPLVGTILYTGMEEVFRIAFGTNFIGWSLAGFGVVFIVLIIFAPNGICGTLGKVFKRKFRQAGASGNRNIYTRE